jgi:hypothetical protein
LFVHLGVAEPGEELAKAQLASLIRDAIKRRRLTRAEAAALTARRARQEILLRPRFSSHQEISL